MLTDCLVQIKNAIGHASVSKQLLVIRNQKNTHFVKAYYSFLRMSSKNISQLNTK